MKGALISERGVHLRDIGLDGFNDLGNPSSETYNPNAVVFADALDIAYAIGSYLGIASPTARVFKAAKANIKFPGNNPGKAPKGFEWKGKPGSKLGSKDGNWYNSKTGESLRPDLNHPKPIGPHWDYKDPSGNWWRIFPDGSRVSK